MNREQKLPVLIVGAGPTGLMSACQLMRHGIPFRIIDKNISATSESRALVLHARTLEIFAQMGIAEKALKQGEPCRGVSWVFNGKEAASLVIEGEDLTPFPYIFCLEQSKTEELLIDYLAEKGCMVERGTELVDCIYDENSVTATLKNNNTEETLLIDYIIGADGAHSLIREKMGLHLEGDTYPQTLFVIDCQVEADIRPNEIYLMATKRGLIGLFPMVQSHNVVAGRRYRVLGVLPAEHKDRPVTFEEIQKDFSDRIEMPGRIYDAAWISTYHTHHRHAKAFRKGRCFIVGDAAHIHSPVGGQGMNTGLQDAYNLIWKFALVIQGQANDSLLNTFNDERIVVAEKLVKTTDKLFYMVAGESVWMKRFRLNILPWILRFVNLLMRHIKAISRANFKMMSQIGIEYRQSILSQDASWGNFSKQAPQPGDRWPCVYFQDKGQKANIQDYLKGTQFHWFIFSKKGCQLELLLSPEIKANQSLLSIDVIPYNSDTESLYKAFGIEQEGYYLVRPDMYIACRAACLDIKFLEKYFQKILQNAI